MFDEDELEQIRDERDDWQGHVDRRTVKKSRTSGKLLAGSLGGSFVVVGFMIFLVFSGMVGSALVGLGGLGGFSADIEKLVGSDVSIYPAIGPTAGCPSGFTDGEFVNGSDSPNALDEQPDNSVKTVPQLKAEIASAEIPNGTNLTLNKDIAVPEIINLRMIRISIGQDASINPSAAGGEGVGGVNLGDTALYVTGLKAGRLQAFDTQIGESYTDGTSTNPKFGPGGAFVLEGTAGGNGDNQVTLSNAKARAHFLSFANLTLPNVNLAIEYYNDSDITELENDPDRIDPVISDSPSGFTDCPVVDGSGQDNPF